jgi:hypothetical protein
MILDQKSPDHRQRRRAFRRLRRLAPLVVVVGLGLVAAYVGLYVGRLSVAGGIASTLPHDATLVLGLVATVVLALIAVSLGRRDRRRAGWIVAVLVLGWAGWIGGNAIAAAQGPEVGYLGTAQVLRGSTTLATIPIQCSSVVGDPTQLADFGTAYNDLEVHLRARVDRSWTPTISDNGGQDLPVGMVVIASIADVVADGLAGHASVTAADGSVLTLAWACDPKTLTRP